jgi:hypothetical protein
MTILKARYELLEKLGEGGMAGVYRAMQLNLDREVVIKFIPGRCRNGPRALCAAAVSDHDPAR